MSRLKSNQKNIISERARLLIHVVEESSEFDHSQPTTEIVDSLDFDHSSFVGKFLRDISTIV